MVTAIHSRRILKTGRPLGLLDVFSKMVENATQALGTTLGKRFRRRSGDPVPRLCEAAAVRRLADLQRHIAPGFAADLYAAADRHELID